MKLYTNSVFTNVFYTSKCFQTSSFFRLIDDLIRVGCQFLGFILSSSSSMPILIQVQNVIPSFSGQKDLFLSLPA